MIMTEPPAGQLRLANPSTVNFTANLVKAMSSMSPSKYFSTGGDEINANCYAQDNQTQEELSTSLLRISAFVNVLRYSSRFSGQDF
jgi:hexosaminidase